jgi:Putative beta-barrel porin 2
VNPPKRRAAVVLALTLTCAVEVTPAQAQSPDPPESAPVQLGPVVLAPVVRLNEFGYDSNPLNKGEADNPEGDMTAIFIPSVGVWLRTAHVRVNGRSQFDMHYFKTMNDLNAVDSDHAARIDLPINRLTPYGTGSLTDTRHRPSLEIDSLSRRRNATVTAGLDLRLTPKLVANVNAHSTRLEYEANSLYLGTDLSQALNHDGRGEGLGLRSAITPYTTVGVTVDRNRDRFDTTVSNDSDSRQVGTFVEFNPAALVSGRASVAFLHSEFLAGTVPDFNGTIASVDLTYTLRARTRILVNAHRDLHYSFYQGQQQYVESGILTSLTQRIGDAWDVAVLVGRGHLTYLDTGVPVTPIPESPPPTSEPYNETTWDTAFDVGYNLRRTRIGFHFENRDRRNADTSRLYARTRIGSTISYTF